MARSSRHHAALVVYRRFLSDEDCFRVARSAAFRAESTVVTRRPVGRSGAIGFRPTIRLAAAVVMVVALVLVGIHVFSPARQAAAPKRVRATPTVTTVFGAPPHTDLTLPGRKLDAPPCGP
ncbi:MAG TPA: hypothetical protein VFX16_28435 [Pseudonocardiaceae bacterium]|nr:hypothetical protein [Pseudonocardiaceae bacterium]